MNFQVLYVPIGVPTFELVSARDLLHKSVQLLTSICKDTICPNDILLSLDALTAYLDGKKPDLIVLQNVTFANAAYASEVLKSFSAPVLLWTLREPVIDGGRLRLNSLTGAFSAANAIHEFRKGEQFEYVFGSPEEKEVIQQIKSTVAAAKIRTELKELRIAAIGHTPEGFGFGRALDVDMMKTFGSKLISIEARELIDKAKAYTDDEAQPYFEKAQKSIVGLETMPDKNVKDFSRLYKAYSEYVTENKIGALASRCWPDFFTSFGTPVCSVLSLLNMDGIAASCESDIYGALSMYIGSKLTGSACFFGDPVSLDESENTITFWHCGMAACSLARKDTGACAGVHCNRKIGPTMEFGCAPAPESTIFRIGRLPDGSFRMFIASGEILDKPKQFNGTSIVVKTDNCSKDIVTTAVKDGWEPHFVVVYGNIVHELTALCHMLNLAVSSY